MPRVCVHLEPPPPVSNGPKYGLCENCQKGPMAITTKPFHVPNGVLINGTYIKRADMPTMTNRHLQMLTDGNRVWVVAHNGMKIDPMLL